MSLLNGVPMIALLLARLSKAKNINQIVLATSDDPKNQPLVEHVKTLGYGTFQGSENDVLERFVQAARKYDADLVVRITGDCPLVDPQIVDACVAGFLENGVYYFSNTLPPSFPDGLDVEVFSRTALEAANKRENLSNGKEENKTADSKTKDSKKPTDSDLPSFYVDPDKSDEDEEEDEDVMW